MYEGKSRLVRKKIKKRKTKYSNYSLFLIELKYYDNNTLTDLDVKLRKINIRKFCTEDI